MYSSKLMVIILNNISIHINLEITTLIEVASDQVHFVPPYLTNFNLIGLKPKTSITKSRCDCFAIKYFKYAAGGIHRMESNALIEARDEIVC